MRFEREFHFSGASKGDGFVSERPKILILTCLVLTTIPQKQPAHSYLPPPLLHLSQRGQ